MLLETASLPYHRFIFEFKGIQPPPKKASGGARKRRRRGQLREEEVSEPLSCYCDATEAGNVTRDMNHFSRILVGNEGEDHEAPAAQSKGNDSASARFVQVWHQLFQRC